MKLAGLTTASFADLLASDAPAPGGGSAAAFEGAIGAALASMVCALTIGKKKYADSQELAAEIKGKADGLKHDLVEAMDKDTDAFNVISDAFGMPKATDEEKAARSKAIQAALVGCTESPLGIMEMCLAALKLVKSAHGKTNESALSDLGVAALSLKAAVQGAWLNVKINIGSMKDADLAGSYRAKGEEILAEALPLADEIYAGVLAAL